ncbi:MAG TPA: ATP-dependent Clp protease ATP-binding subunit [Candidatus Saccharimonadales bacterium]|nr:ATP-dependent Clp protease ATP-binding subunit [Candidatus Saccharimonadales bacterium]
MSTAINLNSARSQKSRLYSSLNKKSVSILLASTLIISLFAGTALLYYENSLAFTAYIPAVIALVIRIWRKGDLSTLAEHMNPGSLDGLIDPEVLANIKTGNPSNYEIFQAASGTDARWFLQARYQIPNELFNLLSKEPNSAIDLWPAVESLAKKYEVSAYKPIIILVALIKSIPEIEAILNRNKMEINDIEQGIVWLENIEEKRRIVSEVRQFGGIARDWAYGYTPILNFLGLNVSEHIKNNGFFADTSLNDKLVDNMIQNLDSGAGSVSLIGDLGAGKTTAVHAFADRIIEDKNVPVSLKNHQVVAIDAPTLLSQTRGKGELEGLMMRVFNEAARAKNIILFLDDAEVFFEQGESSVDLSNIILPVLDNGSVRVIFAMTPKEWQSLASHSSNVASKFHPLQIQPAGEEETLHMLRDQSIFVESQKKVLFTHQSLKEAYKLGSRYDDTQVMPGGALSLLKSAAPLADGGLVTEETIQAAIESSKGVKIKQAKGEESTSLLNLEEDIKKYVISQEQAISAVSNSLRRARSGVGNPDRPVGTFLFLGPTGVGKTELSKALARVYFGDEKSMIRVDMNQYVNTGDTERLITSMQGESLGFLGEVRKKPFSVILLDEIEKADRSVVNLLLQMLDEGFMSDSNNKKVSFKDAIIIATSNAGADEIRRMIDAGEDIVKLQTKLVDLVIERNIFAPEFVNRFDEVVVFKPLTPNELVRVIDLIIGNINKTLDKQKVKVEVSDKAKQWLVDKGYDAKLGARPMRRVAQKYIENIVAKKLLDSSTVSGGVISLDEKDFENIEAS